MGLFSKSSKMKFALIPSTPEQTEARSYLEDLSQRNLNFPTEPVADLTSTEQMVQGQLPSYLVNNQSDYNASRSYLNDVLSGNYDPRSSDYYKGLRQEASTLKAGAQNDVRRQAQKAGMGRSTPSQGIQASVGQQYDTQLLQQLGGLYENERSRMGQASSQLQANNAQAINNTANIQNLAAIERQQQQLKMSAAFNAAIQTMLAPYQYQANIASALLNEQRYIGYQSGGGLTDLGFAASMASGFLSGGGMNMFSGGSGLQNLGTANYSPSGVQSLGSSQGTNFSWSGMGR